ALEARQRACVAVAFRVRAHAVPGGHVSTGQVALRARPMVPGFRERAGCNRVALATTRRRRDAAFAAPVVEAANDDRPVDIPFQEADQDLLAHPRQELAPHARPRVALRHAKPATVVRGSAAVLEVEPDAHAPHRIGVDLAAVPSTDHDGGLVPGRGRPGVEPQARFVGEYRSPWARPGDGSEGVGVADGLGGAFQLMFVPARGAPCAVIRAGGTPCTVIPADAGIQAMVAGFPRTRE